MILYIMIPFVLLFIMPHVQTRTLDKHNKLILWMLVITYVILCGLRDSGGADDSSYRIYYEMDYGGSIFSLLGNKEPLFNIFRELGYLINANYKWMFMCYAVFTAVIIALALKEYFRDEPGLAIYIAAFLFLSYSSMFTVMRQATAMSLMLLLYSRDNLSWKKSVLYWFAIICCHSGFVVVLVFEIIAKKLKYRISRIFRVLVPLVCFGIGQVFNFSPIIEWFTSKIGLFSYMNTSENFGKSTAIGLVLYVSFILYLIKEWLDYRHKWKQDKVCLEKKNKIAYGQMMYFSLLFLTSNLRWGNRVAYYYTLFIPFVIVDLWKLLPVKSKDRKILSLIFKLVLYICFLIVMNGQLGEAGYQWSLNFWN